MSKHYSPDELDAYGHLTWTVGNEDWIACFDAILSPDRTKVLYHVVVNCESGGFVDTIESGECDLASAVAELRGLPDYFYGICLEHYADETGRDEPGSEFYLSDEDTSDCSLRWLEHLESLVSSAPLTPPVVSEDDEESWWTDRELRAMRP